MPQLNQYTWQVTMTNFGHRHPRAPAAKARGPGFDSQWFPRIFSLSAGFLMFLGWRLCGALVQFGCYQHRYECLGPISVRLSLTPLILMAHNPRERDLRVILFSTFWFNNTHLSWGSVCVTYESPHIACVYTCVCVCVCVCVCTHVAIMCTVTQIQMLLLLHGWYFY